MNFWNWLFHRQAREKDLDEEVQAHLRMAAQERIAQGEAVEQARASTAREFGNVLLVKETTRDMWGFRWLETLGQDLRYGLRQLLRNPGFSVVAVLTLALGIGANTAIFSVVNTVLLKSLSLPYRDPDRLVVVSSGDLKNGFGDDISLADFVYWKARNHVFERMAAFEGTWFTLIDDEPQRIHGDFISADWLPTLGVQPMMGRNFIVNEEQPGHNGIVILSNACWRNRFNADPKILDRVLTLNDQKRVVVGVLPPSFTFEDREIFAPLVPGQAVVDHTESGMNFHAYARLGRQVTLQHAQGEMDSMAHQLELQFPATNQGRLVRLVTLRDAATELQPTPRRMHETLWFLFAAVGLVMLVACANVSGLLLARGVVRQREFALRRALGSSAGRIIRQLLTETVLLFVAGGVSGLLLALWSRELLVKTMATYLQNGTVVINICVFLFGLAVSLLAGVAFGLAPALQATRVNLNDSLKDSSPTFGGWRRNRIHHVLVVGEMTLALVLLTGFGLLLRSLMRVDAVSPGFDPTNIVTISAGLEQARYSALSARVALAYGALEKARKIPAVQSAGITDRLPLEGALTIGFSIEGQMVPEGQQPNLKTVAVTQDFFRTLRIPLLEGRMFADRDTASSPPVVVVNQTLARSFFSGANPLGKRLRMEDSPSVWREIVGVVTDVRQRNLDEDSAPIAYRPWDQAPSTDVSLAVRVASSADIPNVASNLRRELRTMDKNQIWERPETMDQLIYESESVSLRRPVVRLLGAFGILAAILTAVGLYGVLSYSVTQRKREIGIRVALGAERNAIVTLVLKQTMRLATAGIGLGIVASLMLTRLLPTGQIGWTGATIHLYGVSRTDLLTFGGASILLAALSALAAYIPARRATKVDPMVALRYE